MKRTLDKTHPELLEEWDYGKNTIKPEKITYGSHKKVWWKCKKCNQKWQANIKHRANKSGCPYCANRKVYKKNCLQTTHPELVKEWLSKNKIKPTEIVAGSNKKVWWKCKKCQNKWESQIAHRTIHQSGCPCCSNVKVCKDNCLATTHPSLVKEWSNKNKIKPTEITAGSEKKVFWKCKKGHEWITNIKFRKQGYNCPICKESKGEKKVSKILDQLKIRYERQYRFKDLNRQPFDFAIFKKYARKPYALIEYHGEQHYRPVQFGGISIERAKNNLKKIKQRDKKKKQYCIDNNIQYIEIPYTQYNNIEKIIQK